MNHAFIYAFLHTVIEEGGFSDNLDDRGGKTKYGISHATYPDEDIENLTLDRAMELAKLDFWDFMKLDHVEDRDVAAEIFDTAYNSGPHSAVKIAQGGLNYLGEGLVEDGVMGFKTMQALNKWGRKDKLALLKALNGFQLINYLAIIEADPSQRAFARGWLRRIAL